MMKSLSNTTRQIALVIMLLILVVIMATCQGAVKGTRKDAPADLSNSGSTISAIKLTANPTRGVEILLSSCVAGHSNKSVGGNQSIGSILITGPALTTVDSMKVILYALPTELSRQILI
jgi:hypothetical protein